MSHAPAGHGPNERWDEEPRWFTTPHGEWWCGRGAGAHGRPKSPARPESGMSVPVTSGGGAPAAGETHVLVALSTPAWTFGGHRQE
jgi:hypothetical protein